jgi:ferrous iron transport protein A
MSQQKSLNSLKIGEKATIVSLKINMVSNKLMEMGCTPGTTVTLQYISPAGCPIAIEIEGNLLAMRREEAQHILIE